MPIVFISPKKRQKQLISFLVGISTILLVLIVWRVFLTKPQVTIDYEEIYKFPEIRIDFEFLDSETLEKLQSFEKLILSEEEEIGRENPFVIYQLLPKEELPEEE